MRRGTIVFIIFILIVAGIIGLSQFFRSQPPLNFTIAVDPLGEAWLRAQVERFNAGNPIVNNTQRISFSVQTMSDVAVWAGSAPWTFESHPTAWLPAYSGSLAYVPSNAPFREARPSVARTVLVWGAFASRGAVLSDDGVLDWAQVARAAQAGSWSALGGAADWQFFKLAFNRPSSAIVGVGVLISAAGHHAGEKTLTRDNIATFSEWFSPIYNSVPNFQTLGANPAQAMATRGTSITDAAILAESQWLLALGDLRAGEAIQFSYPASQVVFDFPLAIWDDNLTSAEARAAVAALGDFLLGAEAQGALAAYGLRPAQADPSAEDALFAAGLPYGISLAPDLSGAVSPPDRNIITQLLGTFN